MAVLYQKDVTNTTTNQTITGTTETAIQTSNNVPLEFGTAKINIAVVLGMTIGTGQTSLAIRIYRGSSISGTLILSSGGIVVTAANLTELAFAAIDTAVAGFGTVQYTVSVQQGGGAGNGTVANVQMEVEVLSG